MNATRQYPDKLEIVPLTMPPNATICVPGSKSITNRALVLGALSDDGLGCKLRNALDSEDTRIMADCLCKLGFDVQPDWSTQRIDIFGPASMPNCPTPFPAKEADLFVGDSGTAMRFLTALVSVRSGKFRLDGSARMRERPIQDLLSALQQLGVQAESELGNGCPPVTVRSNGLAGGKVIVQGETSSQFASALLMAAAEAHGEVSIYLGENTVSKPYIEMTIRMMGQFGIQLRRDSSNQVVVVPIERHFGLNKIEYHIEPDASSAGYFAGAAAITSGRITIFDLPKRSLQGDTAFLGVLREVGCDVTWNDLGATVYGRPLHGIEVDMNAISDCVPTFAAVACFADGPTTIRNVAHIRHKESDRIAALTTELRKVGAEVDEFPDGLRITPRPLHGAEIETFNDHRIAMGMALIGLKVPGIVIKNPGCVAKTYPGYWDDLEKLRQ